MAVPMVKEDKAPAAAALVGINHPDRSVAMNDDLSTRQIAVSETHDNTSGGNVSRHNDDQPKRGRPSVRRAWPLRAENRGQYSGCFATVLPEMRLRSDLCFPAKKGPALC